MSELQMAEIKQKSELIARQLKAARNGEFKSLGAALGLQMLVRERDRMRRALGPLKLVSDSTPKEPHQ